MAAPPTEFWSWLVAQLNQFIGSLVFAPQKIFGCLNNERHRKYFHICASEETFCLIVRDIAFDVG